MRRVERIFVDSFCMLLLLEMLASCTNTGPDIDVDVLLQKTGDKENSAIEDNLPHRSIEEHRPQVAAQGGDYYKVKTGDTLYSIAARSGVALEMLADWNNITAPYTIYEGQKIRLLNSRSLQKRPLQRASKTQISVAKFSEMTHETRISSQKKLTLSKDNRKVLKFYCEWPMRGKILKNFSHSGNKGIDIATEFGHAVKAVAAGKVVYSGQGLLGYGKLLIIEHKQGFLSAYGNNSKLLVTEGQQVETGRVIAEAGMASDNKAALHFEIRKNGEPVNPIEYLPK